MKPDEKVALACSNVTVAFGSVISLADVSIAFEPGLIHAVVGQKGAGRTTFARVAAGLVRPQPGEVSVGVEADRLRQRERGSRRRPGARASELRLAAKFHGGGGHGVRRRA
jgi:ABC-type uncharacterized transport system ATPase subunit